MSGRSPEATRRSRSRGHGWSKPPKGSSSLLRRPQHPISPSSPLPRGTEVEVRVDGDGFPGAWFEATVESFAPPRGRGHRPRYTVTYAHLLSEDDSGAALVEPCAASRVRPRPPHSPAALLRLHDILEAFHSDGWWPGLLLATEPLLAVAFPNPREREVITFQDPCHVRPRRDYVDGQWVPSQSVVAAE